MKLKICENLDIASAWTQNLLAFIKKKCKYCFRTFKIALRIRRRIYPQVVKEIKNSDNPKQLRVKLMHNNNIMQS